MKTRTILRTIAAIAVCIVALSLPSCSLINEPEPDLTVGVVMSITSKASYLTGEGKDQFYTREALVKFADGMTFDQTYIYVKFPDHLSDVIVEGTAVQCRTHCKDIWRYKDANGKWHDVAWGGSMAK